MPSTGKHLILSPTFPLDEEEIKTRSRQLKIGHPLTWGAAGLAILFPFLAIDGMAAAIFAAFICLTIAGVGLSAFWERRAARIEARVIEEMIAESNEAQDRQLRMIVRRYRQNGQHHYAAALGKFLLLKQAVEKRLHPKGVVSQLGEEIERLVDTLCSDVCREFDKVIQLDEKVGDVLISGDPAALSKLQSERSDVLDSIMRAYTTLYESLESVTELDKSAANIPELTAPRSSTEGGTQLSDTVDKLREEIELARRIRDRITIQDTSEEGKNSQLTDHDDEYEKNT